MKIAVWIVSVKQLLIGFVPGLGFFDFLFEFVELLSDLSKFQNVLSLVTQLFSIIYIHFDNLSVDFADFCIALEPLFDKFKLFY